MLVTKEQRTPTLPQLNLSNLGLSATQLNKTIENACYDLTDDASGSHTNNGQNGEDESIVTTTTTYSATDLFSCIKINKLNISHNCIGSRLPTIITESFGCHLTSLNLSDNSITMIDCAIVKLTSLVELNLSSNQLTHKSFPPGFDKVFCERLKILILSGNRLGMIPCQIYKLKQLESLHLGSNLLECVAGEISGLTRLKVLYLGGNKLRCLTNNIGQLSRLEALAVCDNQLEYLPTSISKLRNLKSLALHNNNLTTLPQDIIKLNRLIELSLRNNPLVVRFVQDIAKTRVLPLLELSARAIKTNNIQYLNFEQHKNKKQQQLRPLHNNQEPGHSGCSSSSSSSSSSTSANQQSISGHSSKASSDLPDVLLEYLNSACRCVNPKCKGVYFESKVEHVKFVDFCGSYRLPLLQFLCSQECTDYRTSDEEEEEREDDDDT